jgi:hypothetical protein
MAVGGGQKGSLAALPLFLLAKHLPPALLPHFVGDAPRRQAHELGERECGRQDGMAGPE